MCEKLASPCTRNPAWNLTGVCDLSVEKSAFSCIWHELCRSRAVCRHQLTSMLNAIIVRCHTEHTHTFEPYIVLSRMPHHGWFQLVSIFGNSKVISTPTTRENHELQIRIEEYRRWERQSEFHDWWIHDSLLTIKHSYCTSTYKTVSFFTLFFRSAFHSPKWY